jgi:hypothetical protein
LQRQWHTRQSLKDRAENLVSLDEFLKARYQNIPIELSLCQDRTLGGITGGAYGLLERP